MTNELYPHETVQIEPEIQSNYTNYETNDSHVPNHWHQHLEIIYLQKGRLTVGINENEFDLLPGDIAIINSREIYSTKCIGLIKVILLQVPYALLSDSIPDFEQIRFYNRPEHVADKKELGQLLLQLNSIYVEKTDGWQLHFQSALYQLLYKIYCTGHESISLAVKVKSERNLTRLESIIHYVANHYKEPIPLEKAAQVTGFNPEYFCRFFKKHMGVTFLTYVNRIRLSHIHEELLSTDYTITEILEHHGFSNYHLFMKMFKETYGCTPLQKRKQNFHLE